MNSSIFQNSFLVLDKTSRQKISTNIDWINYKLTFIKYFNDRKYTFKYTRYIHQDKLCVDHKSGYNNFKRLNKVYIDIHPL